MDAVEKLRVLIPHWLEHNRQHREEFDRWAAELQAAGAHDLAAAMGRVMELSQEMDRVLEGALAEAGGPLDAPHHHHHDH